MQKYSKIVVLSRGILVDPKGARRFDNGTDSFAYSISDDPNEFVCKAITKLWKEGACTEFILVGGEVEILENNVKKVFIGSDGKTLSKETVTKSLLVQEYGIPENVFTVLTSASNTQGNVIEAARYFAQEKIEDTSTIGLLTNFYHLPRALKMFQAAGISLSPIAAEGVIYDEESNLIETYYQNEGNGKLLSEIQGMGDYEKGTYAPRFG